MTPRKYANRLNDLVISAALKGERYMLPTLGIASLIAGGAPTMASNTPIDISAIRYTAIPPRTLTYEHVLQHAGEPILPHGPDRVVFAWSPEALATAPHDRAVACVRLENIVAARNAIATYRSAGLAPVRIVVAGSISALDDDVYDEFTATGVVLEELDWERYGEGSRARLERAMEPFYRTLLRLGPTFTDVTQREYTYQTSPTPASDGELRRIGELLRSDDEMFD